MLHLLPPPVALEHRVATVEAVVAELARKSGRSLLARRKMMDEPLDVDLQAHSPDEMMTLIAKAASAEWPQDGKQVALGRSPTLLLALAERDRSFLDSSQVGMMLAEQEVGRSQGDDPTVPDVRERLRQGVAPART